MKSFTYNLLIFSFTIFLSSCDSQEKTNSIQDNLPVENIAQITPVLNESVISEMSQAYGFEVGQTYSLDLIKAKYPSLEPQIKIAQLKFQTSFGNSLLTIDSILSSEGNEWKKIKSQLTEQVKASININNYNKDQLNDFILL